MMTCFSTTSALGAAVALLLAAVPVAAQAPSGESPDGKALAASKTAIEQEYRGKEYEKAKKRLQSAIKFCRKNGCSDQTQARLFHDLGVVFGAGFKDEKRAVLAFRKAMELDPDIKLRPDVAIWKLQKMWKKAKQELKEKAASAPSQAQVPTGIRHAPVEEAQVGYPIPIYVTVAAQSAGAALELRYRPGGSVDWITTTLEPQGAGFGAEIPCEWVSSEGWVDYYVYAKLGAKQGAVSGTEDAPHPINLTAKAVGAAPGFPGQAPPAACTTAPVADVPMPDMSAPVGAAPAPVAPAGPVGPPKKMWIQATVMQDLTFVGGEDVCTFEGQNESFYCMRQWDERQYIGTPLFGVEDKMDTAPRLSTTRILATFRMAMGPLSFGGALGYAFGGGWTPVDATDFLPLHLEARASYWLPGNAFEGFGGYVFVATGIAQMDTEDETWVQEDLRIAPPAAQPDKNLYPFPQLDVMHRAGRMFGALGIGGFLPITPSFGAVVEVRASYLFPATAFALSPSLGAAYGF